MGVDLATILSVMGTAGVGNPLSLDPGFSIGGESRKSHNLLGNLLGLLGTPRGLDGSHNWIEADSSNTRDDLYVTGDASTMNMDLFMEVYESMEKPLSMEDIGNRAAERLGVSIATNPEFYYGPYTGFVVRNAGYAFAGRLLSNHSKEYPRGGQLGKFSYKSTGPHSNIAQTRPHSATSGVCTRRTMASSSTSAAGSASPRTGTASPASMAS